MKEDFFWVMLWNSDFDGGEMRVFLEEVIQHLDDRFEVRLDRYIEKEREIGRSNLRLQKAEAVKYQLRSIAEAINQG